MSHSVFSRSELSRLHATPPGSRQRGDLSHTGVNPAGDAGDTSPPIFWLGDVSENIPTNIITYVRI